MASWQSKVSVQRVVTDSREIEHSPLRNDRKRPLYLLRELALTTELKEARICACLFAAERIDVTPEDDVTPAIIADDGEPAEAAARS